MIEIGRKPKDGKDAKPAINGRDGSFIFTGSQDPTNDIGKDGDLFFNNESTHLFYRNYGKWLFQAKLKGPKGDPGKDAEPTEPTERVVQQVIYQNSGGGGGANKPTAVTETIAAGQTKVVHRLSLSSFLTIEYLFNVRKSDLTKTRSFKMLVNRTDSGLADTIFARLGQGLNYSIDVQIVGLNAEVSITNNEAFDLLATYKHELLI